MTYSESGLALALALALEAATLVFALPALIATTDLGVGFDAVVARVLEVLLAKLLGGADLGGNLLTAEALGVAVPFVAADFALVVVAAALALDLGAATIILSESPPSLNGISANGSSEVVRCFLPLLLYERERERERAKQLA
jgi:hypothetical protein